MNLVLMEEVLNHLHNWFVRDSRTFGDVVISGGSLPDEISEYVSGARFYRILGTYNNDGLHSTTEAEEFEDDSSDTVVVSLMAVPKPLLMLIDEIEAWEEKYGEVSKGPYFSEKFGGYEYQVRGFSSYGVAGSPLSGWRLAFANRFAPWRKMG